MFRCLISLAGSPILRSIKRSFVPWSLFLLFYLHRCHSFQTIVRSLSLFSLYFYSLKEYHIHFPTMRFSSAFAASAIFALSRGAVIGKRALSGQATYYGGNLAGGTCSFSTYTLPSSLFGTALSDSNWDDAAECGACISVTGPNGNSITAMVPSP
jgi:hypothetical protein